MVILYGTLQTVGWFFSVHPVSKQRSFTGFQNVGSRGEN